MVISCAIDAKEGQYKVVNYIHGAFLHTNMETDVHILFEGKITEFIIKLEPSLYRIYVWKNKNSKPMLYVKFKKTLYGTLQAAHYSANYF